MEAGWNTDDRDKAVCTVCGSSTGRPNREVRSNNDVISKGKCPHCWIAEQILQREHMCIWIGKAGNVVDSNAVQHILGPFVCHKKQSPFPPVGSATDVIDGYVMQAVAASKKRLGTIAEGSSQFKPGSDVAYGVVPNCDICNLTVGTTIDPSIRQHIWSGRQQNRKPILRETTPIVLKNICFEQHPLGILKFKVVLHNKRLTGEAANKPACTPHPLNRLKEVVPSNFDVRRSGRRGAAPEEDGFARCLQKVVDNLVGAHWGVPRSTGDCLCVRTSARNRSTVKVIHVRIDYGSIRDTTEINAAGGVIFCAAVSPNAIKDNMVGHPCRINEGEDPAASHRTREFNPNQTIVVGPCVQRNGADASDSLRHDPGENLAGRRTVERGSPRQ